jgi:ATP-dependent Clp protease ATP-binding subunit ClpA
VVAVSTSAAAAMNAIEVLAQKQDRALKEEVAAQNKAVKALANEVHGHGTTLGKHEQALAGVNKTLLEMKPFLQAMGAGKGR